jgi:hypothetical protein
MDVTPQEEGRYITARLYQGVLSPGKKYLPEPLEG